jgi:hypothetical protein
MPGMIGALFLAVFQRWGYVAVSPVVTPIQCVRSLRAFPGPWTIGGSVAPSGRASSHSHFDIGLEHEILTAELALAD